jgi:hypothetical protein
MAAPNTPESISRRRLLLRAGRRPRVLELSCERLYVRYVDACSTGAVPQFLSELQRTLSAADRVRLTDREWLAHDDFRAAIEPSLRACGRLLNDADLDG